MSENKNEHLFFENKLKDFLERYCFNKENLSILKSMIEKVKKQELPAKELKQEIIRQRTEMIKELTEFLPIMIQQESNMRELQEYIKESNSELESVPALKKRIAQLEGLLQECEKKYEELDIALTNILNELNLRS
ncbi:MAG: hypothetical protein ACTSUG_17585 [Candidatus Helarchaeota archaeon]